MDATKETLDAYKIKVGTMKKTTILITALIMLFVGAPQAKAVPMYYTFEGGVTSLTDGPGFIDAQFGSLFDVGDIVTYTAFIDFDAPGTRTYNDTTTYTYPDNPPAYDSFYADAYSGDYLLSTDGGVYNADGDVAEYNYGAESSVSDASSIYINSEDEKMNIYSPSVKFSNLTVGASLLAYNHAYTISGSYSLIESSLTLTSISATPPPVSVPEPSILLLLGSGLLGLGMFRRVRQEG